LNAKIAAWHVRFTAGAGVKFGSGHAYAFDMSRLVHEVMNSELFSLHAGDDVDAAIGYLLGLDISGAPVLDRAGHPIGVAALSDLVSLKGGPRVGERMSRPAVVIDRMATIGEAARLLSEHGIHRLIVVDDRGLAVGIVSALDCVRALCGLPAHHPSAFPHYDRPSGLTWGDDLVLCRENLDLAPNGPGILVLRVGGAGRPETDVWIEPAANVRARVRELLYCPQSDSRLSALLARHGRNLRFRACAVPDSARLREALDRLRKNRDPWVVVNVPLD
jgi:CBS domain-containing protein